MRRKIKFPLMMKDGIEVRNIEGLRENFDLESIINYYLEGKLQRWLQDRNHEDELNQILELDRKSINFNEELCSIFDVAYEECAMDIDIEKTIETNSRINKLKQYTDDERWIEKIDHIMFDQDDLDNRLILVNQYNNLSLEGKTKTGIFEKYHNQLFKDSRYRMYLCGDKFDISDKCENVEYIGVNNPDVSISSKDEVFDADEKNILFSNVRVSSDENITLQLKKINECRVDESRVKVKNKIEVKYNKTIIQHFENNLIILDEEGKVNYLGSFVNGEKCMPRNLPKIIDIDSSLSIVVALDEKGKVHQWGRLPYKFESVPNDLPKIKQVTVDSNIAVALGENGKVYYWGGWDIDKIFTGYHYSGSKYIKMPDITSKIVQIANSGDIIMALDENGKVYSWGYADRKCHNIPSNLPPIKKIILNYGGYWALALDEDGKIHHWGQNEYGIREIPKNIPKIVDISYNSIEYSALDENGKIHIWGDYQKDHRHHYNEVQKLPKLRSVLGYGGVDENGRAHGYIRHGLTREYTELDNIKIMNPIK